jgi:hypothetical protein
LDLQRNLDERKVDVIPWDKFTKFGAYAGLDQQLLI